MNEEQNSKNQPEKRFTTGAITATVWKNESKANPESEFATVTLQRSYKDKDGNWKHTSNLRVNDIPKANLVLQKAYEYLVFKESDQK